MPVNACRTETYDLRKALDRLLRYRSISKSSWPDYSEFSALGKNTQGRAGPSTKNVGHRSPFVNNQSQHKFPCQTAGSSQRHGSSQQTNGSYSVNVPTFLYSERHCLRQSEHRFRPETCNLPATYKNLPIAGTLSMRCRTCFLLSK